MAAKVTDPIYQKRIRELLGGYLEKAISYRRGGETGRGYTLQHCSAILVMTALLGESGEVAWNSCVIAIGLGNPLVNAEMAMRQAVIDESMLLKCRVWIQDGLYKKMETLMGNLDGQPRRRD